MKSMEILALGIRLLGIYALFQVIFAAHSVVMSYYYYPEMLGRMGRPELVFFVLLFLVLLAVAAFCLRFPVTVASWLLPKSSQGSVVFNGSIADFQMTGFILIGVYICTWAIPDIVHNISYLVTIKQADSLLRTSLFEYQINLLVTVIELLVALFLIFQSRGLTRFIQKVRG